MMNDLRRVSDTTTSTTASTTPNKSRRNSDNTNLRSSKRRKSSTQHSSNLKTPPIKPTNHKYLPKNYIDCDKMELIVIISRMLSSIVSINDSRTSLDVQYLNSSSLTRFHSRSPPQISIYTYLVRLAHYSSLENCVLIATVYYIDLLTIKYPSFALNSLTVHRFLLTATTIASKALCDSFCSNNHYAKVGGVNIIELNLLEVEFLKWVSYRVIPRDFNYDSIVERKNSAGSIESNQVKNENSIKFGIAIAEKILSLYYEKMVGLVGGDNKDDTAKRNINIGFNDQFVYHLDDSTEDLISNGSSSSSSSDLDDDEIDDDYDDDEDEEETNQPQQTPKTADVPERKDPLFKEPSTASSSTSSVPFCAPATTTSSSNSSQKSARFSNATMMNTSPSFMHSHSRSPQISTYSPV